MNNWRPGAARGTTVLVGTGQLLVAAAAWARGVPISWPGRDPDGRITCTASDIKTAKDVSIQATLVGVPEVISTIDAVLGLTMLKVKFKSVTGHRQERRAARTVARGQSHSSDTIFEQSVRPSVKDGRHCRCCQGFMDGDELVRDSAARDVPSVGEVSRHSWRRAVGLAWNPSGGACVGNGGRVLMLQRRAASGA
jgi:hypothetical protein